MVERESIEYIKFKLSVFRSDSLAKLSPTAFGLLLILATRLRTDGRIDVEIADVPRFVKKFKRDPAKTKKAFKELLNYTITVGRGKPRTVHILTIDVADDGTTFLKIPKEAGIEIARDDDKKYVRPQYVIWRREAVETLLMTHPGSALATLLSIGVYANDKGTAAPKWDTIVKLQGDSPYIISKNLRHLERAGLIVWEHGSANVRAKFYLKELTGISVC